MLSNSTEKSPVDLKLASTLESMQSICKAELRVAECAFDIPLIYYKWDDGRGEMLPSPLSFRGGFPWRLLCSVSNQ